ncbi:hypothetical protein [Streptomyces sp. S186]|uniref:hypothetical protein n=1 Tax=Streptomyces sp. S186 TaxID=3434395 RepID=UPI003F673317
MSLDTLVVRRAFLAWLRSKRSTLVPGGSGRHRRECLDVLGLDEATLTACANTPQLIVTLPHASPNVFFPRVGVCWYARHLQEVNAAAFHLRVVLTHVNFSDLGWRPYAWWFLDEAGEPARETFFTRNKKAKHVVVASQAPIRAVPPQAVNADRAAAELGLCGADRAVSYMLMTAAIERAAGLTIPGRTLYVPLNLIVEFFRDDHGNGADAAAKWASPLMGSGAGARKVGRSGKLEPADAVREAFVMDNPTNIALLSLLSSPEIVGGGKMAGYWSDIVERVDNANRTSGLNIPAPKLSRLPDNVNYQQHVTPSLSLRQALETEGVGYSQGMAVTEHGAFAERWNPFT